MRITYLFTLFIFLWSSSGFSQDVLKLNEEPNTYPLKGKKIAEYQVDDGSLYQVYMSCHKDGKAIRFTEVEYKYFAKLDRRDLETIKVYTIDVAKLKSAEHGSEIQAVGENDYFGKGDFHKIAITCARSSKAINTKYVDTYSGEAFDEKDTTYMFIYFESEAQAKQAFTSFGLLLSGGGERNDCNDELD